MTEEIDLAEIVRSVAADTDYEARQTGREVRVRRSAEAIVLGDAAFVASAIENVVRNGSRYTPAGTAVDISIGGHRDAWAHRRSRSRPGRSARTKSNGYFCRSTASARRAIATPAEQDWACRSPPAAVKVHGGSIRATNAEGGGLEVSIDIPLYKALHPLSVS